VPGNAIYFVEETDMSLAILGGTGKEGQGLAMRWARAGRQILLGSREREKAERVAAELNENLTKLGALNELGELNGPAVRGMSNRDVAQEGEILISTLPHAGHIEILSSLKAEIAGKLLITATIAWPPGRLDVPSAGEEVQGALGTSARVVAAFQTVSAGTLQTMDSDHQEDVLICSDDKEAAETTRRLVDETGLRGILAGPLERARLMEAITGFLLKLNRRYGVKSTGIRITGIEGK